MTPSKIPNFTQNDLLNLQNALSPEEGSKKIQVTLKKQTRTIPAISDDFDDAKTPSKRERQLPM
jgi:hypothetical protein